MKLLILRHAKTDDDIVTSWSPWPLSPEGAEHAKIILNTMLKKFPELKIKKIISSDIARCAQTAEIMAKELNVPLRLDKGFRGYNIGTGAGVSKREFYKEHPMKFYRYLAPDEALEGGESPNQFFHRVAKAFENLVDHIKNDEDMILMTHRSVIEIIYSLANHIQWSNRIYYYEMEYLLLDLKKNKSVREKKSILPKHKNLHRTARFTQQ